MKKLILSICFLGFFTMAACGGTNGVDAVVEVKQPKPQPDQLVNTTDNNIVKTGSVQIGNSSYNCVFYYQGGVWCDKQ